MNNAPTRTAVGGRFPGPRILGPSRTTNSTDDYGDNRYRSSPHCNWNLPGGARRGGLRPELRAELKALLPDDVLVLGSSHFNTTDSSRSQTVVAKLPPPMMRSTYGATRSRSSRSEVTTQSGPV
jgi:hypothetical protein